MFFLGPCYEGARYENCDQRIQRAVGDPEHRDGSQQPGASGPAEGVLPGEQDRQQQGGRSTFWVRKPSTVLAVNYSFVYTKVLKVTCGEVFGVGRFLEQFLEIEMQKELNWTELNQTAWWKLWWSKQHLVVL